MLTTTTDLSPFFNKTTKTLDGEFMIAEALEGILFIKVWTKRFPEGKLFQIWLQIKGGFILLDDNGKFWYYTALLKRPLKPRRLFALECSRYCGVSRLHLPCLISCRKRRIFYGEPCNPERIKLRLNPLFVGKKMGAIRHFIIDKLQSIEKLLNYG